MKKTFVCDDSMIITIPIGSLKNTREGQLMPQKFQCVFKDTYKVFLTKGRPKPLGAAQAITGVFVLVLGLIFAEKVDLTQVYTFPSILFVVTGILSYAAGLSPNMQLTKLSFFLNIISFTWSLVAVCLCVLWFQFLPENGTYDQKVYSGIRGLIMTMLLVEKIISLFLIYWLSKAICREHFNTLPIVLLKQGD